MDAIPNALDKWPQLFFQYGPFFIALVLMLVCARTIGNNLQAAIDKHAPEPHVRFWRWMYAGIWLFSGLIVIGACVWWVQQRDVESSKEFVVRIDISDVQPTDVLEPFSDDLFYRNRDPGDAARRKDTFVAVAEKPFRANQLLEIVHKKGADASKGVRYAVPISEEMLKERFAAYKLAFNDSKGKYELVASMTAPTRAASHSVIGQAFAMGPSVIPGQPITIPSQSRIQQRSLQLASPQMEPVAGLLDESSSIARQIESLDALIAAVDRGSPPNLFQRRGKGDETLCSYLITLSHHEDKLLAYKARMLLSRMDYIGVVSKIAAGKSSVDADVQRRILLSLEAAEWASIEDRLRKDRILISNTALASRRGSSPVPSATVNGTEYFGVTTWTGLSREQAHCLAGVVFRQDDTAGARPEEALGFVQSRDGFAFSFRTKSEATVFADAATKCGARTEFVYKDDRKLVRYRE